MSVKIGRFGLLTAITVLVLGFGGVTPLFGANTDLEWLAEIPGSESDPIPVLVFLIDDQLDKLVVEASSQADLSRARRIKKVISELNSFRPTNSLAIHKFLKERAASQIERLWIVPAFLVSLTPEDIRELAALDGVARVVPDLAVEPIQPVEVRSAPTSATSSSSHHVMLNVPEAWNLGITGVGRLVCSIDTGVESDHPALTGNWRGNHAPLSSAWFSTIDPTLTPYDKADHGTHTMGIVCGVSGADTIGIAPSAEWITAGVIDQGKSLSATFSDILMAFQWALNPDGDTATTDDVPDVILNSWGVPASLFSPCDDTFFEAIDNVEAAGIVCIFSAGNEGPDPASLRNPASRATSPLNSFAVGAVDNNRVVASFSSRGPGGCGNGAIKPEIVAPGVGVRSAAKDGGYKLMTGTSMAAPFVAGLVALCRQYNPDATVEEIKWAIINSAEDLGPLGEDNAYGYGLPDAVRMLQLLSSPETPRFRLAAFGIEDDGIGMPGETFGLQVTINRLAGSIERISGRLANTNSEPILIPGDSADFLFASASTTSLATQPYQVTFDSNLTNGDMVSLDLILYDSTGFVHDSITFSMPVGLSPQGLMAAEDAGDIQFTVSDFAQYGLAPGSIYNAGGVGFKYDGSDNLLYEAGIIIGRNALQLSGSVRDSAGAFDPSDFVAIESLSDVYYGENGSTHRTAVMDDNLSQLSLPVRVSQRSSSYPSDGLVILQFQLINTDLTTLNDIFFGFLTDFDLPGDQENLTYDAGLGMLMQSGGDSPMIGLVSLGGLDRFQSVANVAGKSGLTRDDKFNLISSVEYLAVTAAPDLMTLITGGPFTVGPGDSVKVTLALVAGNDFESLATKAVRARELYLIPTDVQEPPAGMPGSFLLAQNYPNPFNPTTNIAFELSSAAEVSLEIFNLLGQKVSQIHSGTLSAGRHTLTWDATADNGHPAASGVYFYRLTSGDYSQTRKMVLLR